MFIFEVNGCLVPNETRFSMYFYVLLSGISKLPGSFEISLVKQYLVHFLSLAGIVNVNVYKTETIFTGLEHGELF